MRGGRRLQIDRHAVGQLHRAHELIAFGAGHDLQVQVAAIAEFAAQHLSGIEQPVLGACSAPEDARGQKQAVGDAALVQSEVQARHFVGLEGDALWVASGAESAVQAVALASRRQHRLEQREPAPARHDGHVERDGVAVQIGEP